MGDFLFFCAASDVSHPILARQRGEWPETLSRETVFPFIAVNARMMRSYASLVLPWRRFYPEYYGET